MNPNLNLPARTVRDPIDAFQVNREVKDIKDALRQTPILWGRGIPEGVTQAEIGTLYLNLNGGANTTLYIKESGDKTSTGWVAK